LEKHIKTAVVTSCDKKYIPGVKALYSSFMSNNRYDTEFIIFAHGGSEDFKEFEKCNINIMYNKETIDSPISSNWPVKLPSMYSRLLIPKILSEYDRVLWLDADIIILRDLERLFNIELNETPCAAMLPADHRSGAGTNRNFIPYQLENPSDFPELDKVEAIQAGVVLFNPKRWNELKLNEVVDELLVSGIKFKFVVQGLMGVALKGNFTKLDLEWNARISKVAKLDNISILHFVGGVGYNPWERNMRHGEIWRKYYESFSLL